MQERISVVIPVYNAEPYLERCLKSIAESTYNNLEIICVDDGSTDGSGDILRCFATQDPRVTIVTQENSGVSSTRNRGIAVATGDFVAFVDSDDWVHSQYFEILMCFQRRGDYDLVVCDHHRTSEYITPQDYAFSGIKIEELDLEGLYL